MTSCIHNSLDEFEEILGELPEETTILMGGSKECDLSIWFCRSNSDLEDHLAEIIAASSSCSTWIAWPKKKSDLASDLSQQVVRQFGLNNNLVDYKICAIDKNWSGLLFKIKRHDVF